MIVGASCTAELIQDDPGGLAEAMGLPVPVIPLELPSYQRKENFGADETFFQIVRAPGRAEQRSDRRHQLQHPRPDRARLSPPRRHRRGRQRCSTSIGIAVNVVAPMDATPADIARLGAAHFNVLLYPETAETRLPLAGAGARPALHADRADRRRRHARFPRRGRAARRHVARPAGRGRPAPALVTPVGRHHLPDRQARLHLRRRHPCRCRRPRSPATRWASRWSASAATTANSPARSAALAKEYGVEALITDDYLEVEAAIEALQPELILGTQMERHIGKRLGIPCAVISAPVHVQDFPARYSPQMGCRGRQRHLRHLGASAGHGAGGAPAAHVPRGFRVPRRCRAQPSRRPRAQTAGRRRREPARAERRRRRGVWLDGPSGN